MRVVSLVPSWTETLLQADVEVVGRTRFCIHPDDRVKSIPTVGGTKHWDIDAIRALNPDLILLDQEENPKFMAEQIEFPVLATHVTTIKDVPSALAQMSLRMENVKLGKMAKRWDAVVAWEGLPRWTPDVELPGVLEWGRRPEASLQNIVYIIWRNPWMSVAPNTFIGSMLEKCGLGSYLRNFDERYPKIDLNSFPAAESLLLFSSEPYPFLRKKEVLNPILHPYAFVDGESFSWFGERTLKFLEKLMAGAS